MHWRRTSNLLRIILRFYRGLFEVVTEMAEKTRAQALLEKVQVLIPGGSWS